MRSLFQTFSTTSIFIVSLLLFPQFVHADSLSIIPASGSYEQGKTFSVRVVASSPDQAINAVSGSLSFPTDKLQVVSVSKANSILTLWVQDPSFSNTQGTVSFEGVVPNPGFIGSQGTVAVVVFKVIREGSAQVKVTTGTLLANDGLGTNILKSTNNATYSFTPKVEEVPKEPEKTPEVTPVVIESIKAPTITDYPHKIEEGSPMTIRGITYQNAEVVLTLKDSRGQIFTQTVKSNEVGDFSVVWPDKINRGDYELTAIVTYKGVKSLPSDVLTITVTQALVSRLKFTFVDYTSLIIIGLLCIGSIVFIILFFIRGLIVFKRKIWRDTNAMSKNINFEFIALRDAIRKELSVLDHARSRRDLTREETTILERVDRHITRIEKGLNRRIEDIKRDIR